MLLMHSADLDVDCNTLPVDFGAGKELRRVRQVSKLALAAPACVEVN